MTKRDVIALASKILGFFSLVNVAWYIPQAFSLVALVSSENVQGGKLGVWLVVAVGFSFYGLIAWFLISRADMIGSWLYPEEEAQAAVVGLDKEVLLQIALIAIGVFLVSRALSALPGMIVVIRWKTPYAGANEWAAFLRVVLEAAIGLYLALRTRGIIRAIEYLRGR